MFCGLNAKLAIIFLKISILKQQMHYDFLLIQIAQLKKHFYIKLQIRDVFLSKKMLLSGFEDLKISRLI